jgi:propanediol dehydratase small subunit
VTILRIFERSSALRASDSRVRYPGFALGANAKWVDVRFVAAEITECPDDVIYLRFAFLRAPTPPRLYLASSISNARSRYQAAIFNNFALRFASVAVLARS